MLKFNELSLVCSLVLWVTDLYAPKAPVTPVNLGLNEKTNLDGKFSDQRTEDSECKKKEDVGLLLKLIDKLNVIPWYILEILASLTGMD